MDDETRLIYQILIEFPWYDYGLDFISDAEPEWAEALAERIVDAH